VQKLDPMKQFAFVLVLALGASSLGHASPLADYLRPRMAVLNRPLMTFHYSKDQAEPASQAEVFEKASKVARGFNNSDRVDANNFGPGFYVSPDPFASRVFGGVAAPQLTVVTLKEGARILDMRKHTEDAEYAKIMIDAGCVSDFGRNGDSKICRQTLIDAYLELKVQAVLYNYLASATINGCEKGGGIALNVVDDSAMDAETISYYSTEKLEPQAGLGKFISRLYEEASQDFDLNKFLNVPQWTPLPTSLNDVGAMNADEYLNMKKQMIWNCGEPWLGKL
jgi:hypothetical protein